MDIRGYEYKTNEELLNYEFCSEGPKGEIRKVVRFTLRNANGVSYFNLGFGDWDATKTHMDDMAVSNNHDKDIILATIASIVVDFTSRYEDIGIYAQGSTQARTRLYQMGIAANLDKITPILTIYGYINYEWQLFQKNVNYDAFWAVRK
jgi:hypothetical protein